MHSCRWPSLNAARWQKRAETRTCSVDLCRGENHMDAGRRCRIVSRAALALAVVLDFGCMQSRGLPNISTELPGTEYSIDLHGPDDGDIYYYTIGSPDGDCGLRHLGKIRLNHPVTPKLEELGSGVFRTTWSDAPNDAFATIDTEKKLYVDDSNESNSKNQPFETPRYLRPEYAKLRESAIQSEQQLKQRTAPR